jgi:Asp-tRNA(Asn)/Glu-tRNA(Gln) amidotransferase A subunit family amidase
MLAMDRGDLTSETLTAACLGRIRDRDSDVQAWSWIDDDLAMTGARAADAARRHGSPLGPLHGLPIGVKDVMLTRDMPTQYNSPLYAGFRPGGDAACVAILRSAGAVMLGKTHTVEFAATGRPPPTRNPHDPSRTPGGSSSGSAAAVADRHVPLALGTQTGGSIVRPASYCGVWGLKPTWGLVSTEGCKAFAPSLDTVGWFARTVGDLDLLLDVFDPPPKLHGTVMRGEGRAAFLPQVRADPSRLHESIAAMVAGDTVVSRDALRGAYGLADKARVAFETAAAGFDAVLAPSAVDEAPVGLASTGGFGLNGGWTLLHGPVVNVPGLRGGHGMPVGVTLAGARFTDRRVLAVAELLARALTP